MKITEEEFYKEVVAGIAGCQWVEERLKRYLSEAYLLAKECIGNRMVYKFSGLDVENFSLGKLIDAFSRFSDDEKLIEDLKIFCKERNFLSHKAITFCHDPEGFSDTIALQVKLRLSTLQENAKELCSRIHELAGKLTVERVFGSQITNE